MSLLLFMFLFIATNSYQTNPKSNHESMFSKKLPKRRRFLGIHLVICFYGFGPKLNRPDVLQTSVASIKSLAVPVDLQRNLVFRCHFLCFIMKTFSFCCHRLYFASVVKHLLIYLTFFSKNVFSKSLCCK